MPTPTHSTTTSIARSDMTADQLALPGSERVRAETRYGAVVGGRVRNGCQVFLSKSSMMSLGMSMSLGLSWLILALLLAPHSASLLRSS
jgi:hypothetical protein